MEPIEEIGVPNVTIPQIVQRDWLIGVPFVPNNDPPVTLQLGFPIVEMPGCVTMHKDNKDHVSGRPFDRDLVNQDPKGTTTLCPHGEYPSYEAMDYQPENLVVTSHMSQIVVGLFGEAWHLRLSGAVISMIVPLIVFFSLQRFFIRGLIGGAVKG